MRTLYIDIETAPITAYVWGLFNQNIGLNQIISPTRVICAAWSFDDESMEFAAEWDRGGTRRMVKRLHSALDEAEALVHYNGASFDTPHLFREFLEQGLNPPAPFAQVDLYRAIKKSFKFPSGKLAYVAKALELRSGGKLSTDMTLWTRVLDGDRDAQAEMQAYNEQDVVLLKDLYDKLLPWIPNHPNVGLYEDGEEAVCPGCGSTDLQSRGLARTSASTYRRYQCKDCGKWSRGKSRVTSTELRSVVNA